MAHPRQGEVFWAKLDPTIGRLGKRLAAIDAEPALRILRTMFA
jgi:hypothetical protein